MDETLRRIDRLESTDAIRQLVSRYGLVLDARDIEGAVQLFVDDVRLSRTEQGHDALRRLLDHLMRQFTTSVHFVGNHTIDFVDDDHAEGVVYCKAEHEYGEEWIELALQYWDRYERRNGRWLFTGRQLKHWFAVDRLERPNGPDKTRWSVTGPHTVPHIYPTWDAFWSERPA